MHSSSINFWKIVISCYYFSSTSISSNLKLSKFCPFCQINIEKNCHYNIKRISLFNNLSVVSFWRSNCELAMALPWLFPRKFSSCINFINSDFLLLILYSLLINCLAINSYTPSSQLWRIWESLWWQRQLIWVDLKCQTSFSTKIYN